MANGHDPGTGELYMSNYLIDLMTWSHSRLGCYIQCPYQFYLKYIEALDGQPMFFASFGSLIHDLLAGYYRGETPAGELSSQFMMRFPFEVVGRAPSDTMRASYFRQGAECLRAPSPISGKILGVEERVSFDIGGRPFVGFVDLVYEDEDSALYILDHKSRALKSRSARKKPTKTDAELDEFLRQLYLYAIPIERKYGRFPDFLEFNCYRTGERIKEEFHLDALEETKRWALGTIENIRQESEWRPNLDYWRCKYMCGYYDQCEYAQMTDWRAEA